MLYQLLVFCLGLNRWISICISSHCRRYWYFRYYTFFDYDKPSSISQLINDKLSNLIFILIIICFISRIILQTSWRHRIIVTIFLQIIHWHKNIKIFFISTKVLLMHDQIGALFLKIILLFLVLAPLFPSTVRVPFTTVYVSLWSHKLDLNIEVLILIFFLTKYWPLD